MSAIEEGSKRILIPETAIKVDFNPKYVFVLAEYYNAPEAAREAICKYPVLGYLLGSVTKGITGDGQYYFDDRPDGKFRPVSLLEGGVGLFGLVGEDADRWKGMFNHLAGSADRVFKLTRLVKSLSNEQVAKIEAAGYDLSSFNLLKQLSPDNIEEVLWNFQLLSHLSRRKGDEDKWHRGNSETLADAYKESLQLMQTLGIPEAYQKLLLVGNHGFLLNLLTPKSDIPDEKKVDFLVILLTYADWSFGQNAVHPSKRFADMINDWFGDDDDPNKKVRGTTKAELMIFKAAAIQFEQTLSQIINADLFDTLEEMPTEQREIDIRQAYAACVGIPMEELFPNFKIKKEKNESSVV
ncbi:hypothetical protein GYA19_03985 [Candidatus Beckwithbacteria bacterium]|nr:hypothetical protein [Candidatus Beckwithbacteria bacterium]